MAEPEIGQTHQGELLPLSWVLPTQSPGPNSSGRRCHGGCCGQQGHFRLCHGGPPWDLGLPTRACTSWGAGRGHDPGGLSDVLALVHSQVLFVQAFPEFLAQLLDQVGQLAGSL